MQYRIPVSSDLVRTITDPNSSADRTVYALLAVQDLPYDIGLGPDPRVPKPRSPIVKRITASLSSWDGRFHLLNRGITISAKDVEYDNKAQILTIDIPTDDQRYGIIDGGHTYHSIVRVIEELMGDGVGMPDARNQYVRLEIMKGVENNLSDIAQARNYSINVKPFSLAHKKGDFQWLMYALGDKASVVKFSENDEEPVLVLDVLQLLTCVNRDRFTDANHPIEAYKNMAKCLDWVLEPDDKWGYRKLAPLVLDICRLYDYIRFRWAELYNTPDEDGKTGRYGATSEAKRRKRHRTTLTTYHFQEDKGKYPVEKGLAFPVLSGFRALVTEGDDGLCQWTTDPFVFFDEHGKRLISIVLTASEKRNNDPHLVGRDESVYAAVYSEVRRWWLEDELKKREEATA